MVVAEDAGKSPGSHVIAVIAVIARDRKTKSHHGGAEKNWRLTAKDAKECKAYHGGAERLRGGLATKVESKDRENISFVHAASGSSTPCIRMTGIKISRS